MPITPNVLLRPSSRALGALFGALLVLSAPGIATAGTAAAARPAKARTGAGRPARAPGTDPTTRILSLTALVASREQAANDAQNRRATTVADLQQARRSENLALARADLLSRAADAAEVRYQLARDRAGQVAAAVYRNAGQAHSLARLLDSRSPAEYGYHQGIAQAAGDVQMQIVQRAVVTKRAAARLAAEADRQKAQFHEQVNTLQNALPARDREVDRTQAVLARGKFWLSRWQSLASGVNTPIMSRSVLSPSEMAAWFEGTHRHARITVSMLQLAQDYIDEGTAAGVRGDIAFAQSILETGSFYFPDGGQLAPTDNNFAGMDACDSCAHGRAFPDARIGVRAQLQQLRVYADPTVTNASFNPPPVVANLDQHSLKGKVSTWNGLTHTWATADAYGDRILQIYAQMLGWLTDRASI
jgi:hypothetical protein